MIIFFKHSVVLFFFQRKCDMYWPKDPGNPVSYGPFEVQLEREQALANYTVRTMKLKYLKVSSGRICKRAL